MFFRVVGGNSSSFTDVQEENSPHLIEVEYGGWMNYIDKVDIAEANRFEQYQHQHVTSGCGGGESCSWMGMAFKVSSGEVRPRNQAMRIWKRV